MKVLKFDKDSVTPKDIVARMGECLKEEDVKKTAVIHETSDGTLLVAYSDMDYSDLLVMGATMQDFAMDKMKGNV